MRTGHGCGLLAVPRSSYTEPPAIDPFPELDGGSHAIRQLKRHMLSVARDPDVTALVLGESGTGKERVARAIHRASPRAHAPFVVVDCTNLSPTLAEDQLFGHVRGAFTGAVLDQPGPFERACGGTVLLDEVGDLTRELQMKLLRAIQARSIQRLGGQREVSFDVRIIASTNVDLAQATAQGRFREDLYYRLKVYEIGVPPLRERGGADLQALVRSILTRFAQRRRRAVPGIEAAALELLARHKWPGNVRELENVLERMMVAAGGASTLTVRHVADDFGVQVSAAPSALARRRESLPSMAEITATLQRHGSQRAASAADLGLSRHQLYRLLKRYGIGASSVGG
jgi:transcriptional regulator with PAS, ATPase and Fis domain